MNEKDKRQIYIDKTRKEIKGNYIYHWYDLGSGQMLLKYEIRKLGQDKVIVKIQDKTTTGLYINSDINIDCPEIQRVFTLAVYEWVNSYKTNYNKEVYIVNKVSDVSRKTTLKNLLTIAPSNEEDAIEYLKTYIEYFKLYESKNIYNDDCITLNHLNILSGIAENTGYIGIYRILNHIEYNEVLYIDVRNYVEGLKDFIEEIIKEREEE